MHICQKSNPQINSKSGTSNQTPTKPKKPQFNTILMATLTLVITLLTLNTQPIYAKDKCKDIDDLSDRTECYEKAEEETKQKLAETQENLSNTLANINNLSSQLNVTQAELNQVQNDIDDIKAELELINESLDQTQDKLEDKISFRNQVLRNYSKKNVLNDLELFFLGSSSKLSGFQFSAFVHAYNKATSEESLKIISALNTDIKGYEEDKAETEDIKNQLETAQANLVSLSNDLASKKANEEEEATILGEKKSAYEEELEELQKKIISLKYGEGNGTVGDYASPGAETPDPPFKPAFAVFSYGAYTHYKGMSQYGAKGRAEDGDDYKDIIEFYYKEDVKEKDVPSKICVEGYGDMDFQKYLYGIAEMPSSWPEDALKAQAVAARTYAYRYAKQGKCICTTQSCQVFLKSKSDNPPDSWKKAVDDTEDKIVDGDIVTYYSSTTGGYIENIGWDVDGKWPGDAYEKKAKSPWFYKAWYTKSYSDGSTCGHSHPWLTEEEMADILNSWVVYKKGSDKDKSHISPITTDCWGGDPYSLDKMKDKADEYGDNYSSISKVWVDISNSGYTSVVYFQTNRGTVSIDGETFKTVFNLRAPGYVAVRSRLFDIERRD